MSLWQKTQEFTSYKHFLTGLLIASYILFWKWAPVSSGSVNHPQTVRMTSAASASVVFHPLSDCWSEAYQAPVSVRLTEIMESL